MPFKIKKKKNHTNFSIIQITQLPTDIARTLLAFYSNFAVFAARSNIVDSYISLDFWVANSLELIFEPRCFASRPNSLESYIFFEYCSLENNIRTSLLRSSFEWSFEFSIIICKCRCYYSSFEYFRVLYISCATFALRIFFFLKSIFEPRCFAARSNIEESYISFEFGCATSLENDIRISLLRSSFEYIRFISFDRILFCEFLFLKLYSNLAASQLVRMIIWIFYSHLRTSLLRSSLLVQILSFKYIRIIFKPRCFAARFNFSF